MPKRTKPYAAIKRNIGALDVQAEKVRQIESGKPIAAFTGISGTGKTMGAEATPATLAGRAAKTKRPSTAKSSKGEKAPL